MPPKKAVKKVEITDESVLDLKAKTKTSSKDSQMMADEPINFSIHKIEGEREQRLPVSGKMFGEAPLAVENDLSVAVATEARSLDAHELHQKMDRFSEKLDRVVIKVGTSEESSTPTPSNVAADPKDLIKVKFEKFVQLVATKDFLSVLEKNRNEDVILSSNLLTELASAVEEKGEKKSPVIFLVGLAIGVIITYLLVNQ